MDSKSEMTKSETTEEKYETPTPKVKSFVAMKKSEEKEKSSPMKPIPLPIVKQISGTPKVKSFVAMKKSEEKEKSSPMKPIPLPIVKQISGQLFEEKVTDDDSVYGSGSDSGKSNDSAKTNKTSDSGGDSESVEDLSVEEAKEKRRLKIERDKENLERKLKLLELPQAGPKRLLELADDLEP